MAADNTWTINNQEFHFAACSGARLVNIVKDAQGDNPPQLSQLGNPQMITYHAGGNNCDFGAVVFTCIYPVGNWDPTLEYPNPDGDCAKGVATTNKYINDKGGLYQDEMNTVRDILTDGSVKGNKDFKLYLLGYAHFFNTNDNYCNDISFSLPSQISIPGTPIGVPGPKLSVRLRTDFNDAIERVNNVLRRVVRIFSESP
jgi:hypothetical protein